MGLHGGRTNHRSYDRKRIIPRPHKFEIRLCSCLHHSLLSLSDMKFNGPHTLVVAACGGSLAIADLSYSDVGLTHVNEMVKKNGFQNTCY